MFQNNVPNNNKIFLRNAENIHIIKIKKHFLILGGIL